MNNLALIETILRDRQAVFAEIRRGANLPAAIRTMLLFSAAFLALYGGVMGSTHSVLQVLSSALKLPLLFLATLVVCAPTLYFFNLIFGSNQSLSQNIALMLTAITITSVVLRNLRTVQLPWTPIVLFFLLTSSSYQFFKLLNVGVFMVAGFVGVSYLSQGMRAISGSRVEGARARANLVRLWILIYAFVGSQAAWTLRPFVGAPSMTFEFLRPLGGNFYANIFVSLGELLGFFTVR